MKYLMLALLFVCLIQFGKSQNPVNNVLEELQMKQYDKDPAAEAVVLFDSGVSSFHLTEYSGFEITYERATRIKIFTKAGIKWSEISIPYYRENSNRGEVIYDLKGTVSNMVNGNIQKTELDIKKTYKEKIDEHWNVMKFAMPDVREGSVIELTYKIDTPFLMNFRNWEFQSRIPVVFSKYVAKMIPFYEYRYILQGAKNFDYFNSNVESGLYRLPTGVGTLQYQNTAYEFIMKDVPAFSDESYITSINDYIIKVDFQLSNIHHVDGKNELVMSTWPKLSNELIENQFFGKYINSCERRAKDFADDLKLGSKSQIEKAKIIDRFMKLNYSWDGNPGKFAYKNVKEFLTAKTGNAAEINLFLVGLLNAAGIEANPLILSTRSNGKLKADYPFHHLFNYVVAAAKIDGTTHLLDATEPFCLFGEIPSRCINDKGFVVQKGKEEWVNLKANSSSVTEYNYEWVMNTTGDSVIGKCKLASTGYDAINLRNKYIDSYKNLKTKLTGANSISSDSLKASNLKEIEKPFEIGYSLKYQVEKIEDKLAVTLLPHAVITENPLKQLARNYPVDMTYRSANKYQVILKIPQGYKLLVKPESMSIDNNLVKINYNTESKDDEIKVSGYYEFKNDVYSSSEYSDIKGYFNKIVDKFNEKVILGKI